MIIKFMNIAVIIGLMLLVGCETKYKSITVQIEGNKTITFDFNCTDNSPAMYHCRNIYVGCANAFSRIYCKDPLEENRSEAIRLKNFSLICGDEYYSELETFCIRNTNECLAVWSKEIGKRFDRFQDPNECVLANKSNYDGYYR